jgi:hypothetical protein
MKYSLALLIFMGSVSSGIAGDFTPAPGSRFAESTCLPLCARQLQSCQKQCQAGQKCDKCESDQAACIAGCRRTGG